MIINKTKDTTLADVVIYADNPLKRMKGLLGRRSLGASEAMVIKPCNAIHTFFMRFSIDVLFVNKDFKVVKVIPNMPTFRLSPICFSSQFVVELPVGAIQATHTALGDELAID
ncbi:MAG: DUF192 domain-containing protein [Candidatus Omnitrophica bacterium]|nr:DUF192 domain-containing protein [Candidatus Omnitrophota bacterium]